MPGNPEFGCDIWDLQFEQIQDQRRWIDAIEDSLTQGIKIFESRLGDAQVMVNLREVEVAYPFRKYPDIKHQAHIHVKAHLRHSGEPFNFSTDVFVSPISG
jgi:predicted component of type VI protein secretion system